METETLSHPQRLGAEGKGEGVGDARGVSSLAMANSVQEYTILARNGFSTYARREQVGGKARSAR